MRVDQFLIRLDGVFESELIRCPISLVIEPVCPVAPAKEGKSRSDSGTRFRNEPADG
jgi:hypothetical protein